MRLLPLVGILGLIFLVGNMHQFVFANDSHPFMTKWGESGINQGGGFFSFPQSIATDSSGNVYVTDLGNMRIQKFDNNGMFLNSWGSMGSGSGEFNSPSGIAVYENYVFVVDNQLNNIQKFDLDGNFIAKWGSEGSNIGQFSLPNGIAIGNNGTVFVADTGNSRIQKFTSEGDFVFEFGKIGNVAGTLLSPKGIVIDNQGNVYVSDPGQNKISKFDFEGIFLESFEGNVAGYPITPEGLEITLNGNIYFADTTRDRIVYMDSTGLAITTFGSMGILSEQFKMPKDVALDPFGNLFVVDSNGHRIQKFATPLNQLMTSLAVTETVIGDQVQNISQLPESSSVSESSSLPEINPIPGDLTKPTIIPPNDLLIEATSGLTPVSVGQAMASDESGIASLTSNAPLNFPIGTTTIIWTAIDGAGNMGIATQLITVVDTTPPIIKAPQEVTIEAKSLNQNDVDLGNAISSDAIGIMSITNNAPEFFPLGETIVTWTAEDAVGNISTDIQKVTVVDTTSPELFPPEDIILEATSFDQNSIYLGEPIVIDNGEILSVSNDSPLFFGLGNTTVTWIASDTAGNIVTRQQIVSLIDTTAPEIAAPANVSFEATSQESNLIDLGIATVSDIQQITITNDSPEFFQLGETIVTWSATDESGNTNISFQTVSVIDTTPPVLIVPDDITIEATGLEGNSVELGEVTIEDNTSIASITNNAPATFPFGTTVVTWTAADMYDNIAVSEQIISVIDTTPPKITAPNDITIEAVDLEQNFAVLGNVKASDIIDVESITNDAPDSFPIGMSTITWTAVDTSGNISTDTQTVSVVDTTPPTISAPSNVVAEAISSSGMTISIGDILTDDITGIASITNDAPELFNLGDTIITWSVTDTHGNTAIAEQLVTVIDTTPPILSPPDDIVIEAQNPTSNVIEIGMADAQDIVGVELIENDAPDSFSLGDTLVNWYVHDAAGNVATSTQKISVVDTTPPIISSPADIEMEATSELENIVPLGDAIVSDLIGINLVTNDAPDYFPVGETLVTWTVTDHSGLSSSATQIVNIVDTTAPTIHETDVITVEATSMTNNVVDFGIITANDAVGITSIENDAPDFFPFGLTTVTWTVSDKTGNISTTTQEIHVIDTSLPSLSVPKDIVLEAIHPENNSVELGTALASDLVSVDSITNNAPDLFPIGETLVQWTATDSSGNSVNVTQMVTLVDTTPPSVASLNEVIFEATSKNQNKVSLEIPESEDTISQVIITNDAPDTFSVGETIVTWTVTDEAGNSASTEQLVRLIDTTPPELIVPDDVLVNAHAMESLVSIGQAVSEDFIDESPVISNDAPLLFSLGETVVTWNTVDEFGNSQSSTQIINVQACGKSPSYYNIIVGGPEDDLLVGTNLSDLIFAFSGDDIISGGKGNDCIFGEEGDDIIFGNEGNDGISGGEGSDVLKGQSGNDQISGGFGLDVIDGGDDIDSCNVDTESDDDIEVKCET